MQQSRASRWWLLAVSFGAFAAGACSSPEAPGVLLRIRTDGRGPRPDVLRLSWADLAGRQFFTDREVAVAVSTFSDSDLASVFVAVEPSTRGERQVVAVGLRSQTPVSRAEALVSVGGERRIERDLVLETLSEADGGTTWPDRDAGTAPDAVSAPARGRALLVIRDPGSLRADERYVHTRLASLGFDMLIRADADVTAGDAADKSLVVLPPTTNEAVLKEKLKNVAVPIVCLDGFTFRSLGMASTTGRDPGRSQLELLGNSGPLAAGLSGIVAITTSPVTLGWSHPTATAEVVATYPGDPKKISIFAYEARARMTEMEAPARRVGWFIGSESLPLMTPEGARLLDAALLWASNR